MGSDSEFQRLQALARSARELRTLIQSDPHRPIYHFVCPEGHTFPFDPNGAIYWKGKYHLGFIYQRRPAPEYSPDSGHVWGHAVSTDLLHWTIYPDMLGINEGDPEIAIFSGGAFVSKEGVPHVVYFGKGASATLLAHAEDDDLRVWKKHPTPAMRVPDPPHDAYTVSDPCAWYDDRSGYYYYISGGMKPGLFKSKDLHDWKFLGSAVGNDGSRHEFEDVDCPAFFRVGDKWMLLFISHTLGAQYYLGDFSNDRFTPERHGRMNWPGGGFFAAEQLRDESGRNIIWGWITQHTRPSHLRDYGWSGIMSLPRVVSLDEAGEVRINPPEEIKTIRLRETREADVILRQNQEITLEARGKSIELSIELAGGARSPFGIKVFASPDGREQTIIRYDPQGQELVIDFSRSSVTGPVSAPAFLFTQVGMPNFHPDTNEAHKAFVNKVSAQKAPLKLRNGEILKLDVFLDRSVIEVFANGRQAITQMVYPELENSNRIAVFSGGEAVTVTNIHSWVMAETNAY